MYAIFTIHARSAMHTISTVHARSTIHGRTTIHMRTAEPARFPMPARFTMHASSIKSNVHKILTVTHDTFYKEISMYKIKRKRTRH